jgi:multiple sugar transport system substrate-binding protein
MRETASPAMDKVTSLAGGTGVRLSTWNDPEVRAQFQYYQELETVHQGSDTMPGIPEYPAINDVLSRMTWDAVQGKDVAAALREASAECAALLAHYQR